MKFQLSSKITFVVLTLMAMNAMAADPAPRPNVKEYFRKLFQEKTCSSYNKEKKFETWLDSKYKESDSSERWREEDSRQIGLTILASSRAMTALIKASDPEFRGEVIVLGPDAQETEFVAKNFARSTMHLLCVKQSPQSATCDYYMGMGMSLTPTCYTNKGGKINRLDPHEEHSYQKQSAPAVQGGAA